MAFQQQLATIQGQMPSPGRGNNEPVIERLQLAPQQQLLLGNPIKTHL